MAVNELRAGGPLGPVTSRVPQAARPNVSGVRASQMGFIPSAIQDMPFALPRVIADPGIVHRARRTDNVRGTSGPQSRRLAPSPRTNSVLRGEPRGPNAATWTMFT